MNIHSKPIRILVVGCGNMRASHAVSYHTNDGFEIYGLVSCGNSKEILNNILRNEYDLQHHGWRNGRFAAGCCLYLHVPWYAWGIRVKGIRKRVPRLIEKSRAATVEGAAVFVKDVFGPNGSVSIVTKEVSAWGKSDSIEAQIKTEALRVHHAGLTNTVSSQSKMSGSIWMTNPTIRSYATGSRLIFWMQLLMM